MEVPFNIHSLACNFGRLLIFVIRFWQNNVHLKSSCISVSETLLQNSFYNCDIPGYNFVHSPHLNKVGGSVGIYVTRELELRMRDDLSLKGENCAESLFIEIHRPNEKNILIIGTLHHPPDQCAGFCWQHGSAYYQNL